MSDVLVTGAAGFVGGAIVDALIRRGDTVIALDPVPSPRLNALAEKFGTLTLISGDVCDRDAVEGIFARYRPRDVIHCAAIVGVLASLETPAKLFKVNIEGSINLFEAMARSGTRRMIHISSEEIYGEFSADIVDETHAVAPLHAYGISKAAVEQLGRSYRVTHGVECINIRTSWVYGPGFPRDRVPLNMIRAAAEGRALHVPGGGDERIDHTYLDDAVEGALLALDCQSHAYDAYHVASGTAPSLAEIAAILREMAPGVEITIAPGRYKHGGEIAIPRKGALDCRRAAETFGYRPRFDIRAGVRATFDAHRASLGIQI